VDIRRTRSADLPRLHDIFNRAIGSLFRPHGFDPPTPSLTVFSAQQQHLLANDAELCSVAELDGAIVGFASAWVRGRDWFLASLFVEPARQGAGVGAALLDAVWGEEPVRRRTITDAIQPVANALYAARGLVPTTPLLAFDGSPRSVSGPPLEPAAPTADPIRELDRIAYGFERARDHALWMGLAECTLWLRAGRAVAYSYRFPDGTIGPIAGASGSAAGDALTAELSRTHTPQVRVRIPGSARELVAVAVQAGLRLGPTPGLLLLGEGVEPPTSLAVASYTLF